MMRISSPLYQEKFIPCGRRKEDQNGRIAQENSRKRSKTKPSDVLRYERPSFENEKDKNKHIFKKKKCLMATWEDLNLSSCEEENQEANIYLMVDTSLKLEEKDKKENTYCLNVE
ncbi:hypothetical protein CR513_18398, partial [Mucuna pruriens]